MSQFRFAALSLVAAVGCYSDAQPPSTFPEPHYVAGPPGGAIDPGWSYAAYPGEPGTASPPPGQDDAGATASEDDDAVADDAVDNDASAAAAQAPADETSAGNTDPPSVAIGPGAPAPEVDGDASAEAADPTAAVSDAEIDGALAGYGQWIDTDDYGEVWRPDATVVGVDFTPYESGGSWEYTDAGWAFSCEYPWGWLPFHYGRWAWLHDYWAWVPGHRWGPAWVHWRHGGGVVGWRPIPPRARDHRHDGGHRHPVVLRDHRRAEQHDAHWRFATVSDFSRPHVRSHRYGNLAEGLRVTSTVKAPPVQSRVTVRAADLMRNRFATSGRFMPGRGRFSGAPLLRDPRGAPRSPIHRLPVQPYQPSVRDHRPPVQIYQPPVRDHRPPVQTYQPPVQTYQPPVQTYQPPVRDHRPPVQTYQPPVRDHRPPVQTYQPPVRDHRPPVQTYQPPVRDHRPSAPPSHVWTPPSHSASPPPSSGSSHSGNSGSHSTSSSSSDSSSHSRSNHSDSSHSSGSSSHHRR